MIDILVNTGYNQQNRRLDTYQDETFSISYSIADINDIASSNGAYTKTIDIPNTANNRKIFGFVTDLSVDLDHGYGYNYANSFNPNKKVRCYVLENSVLILEGYLQLTKFSIDDLTNSKTLSCVIYADNATFFQSMGDGLISDLDFSEFSFTYSTNFITSTWNNDIDNYTKGVYFPIIDYGNGWTLDDLNNGTLNRLGVKDFKPAVFAKVIWDKIFKSHGYYCASNFTGGNDPRFSNLIIPYNAPTFQGGPNYNKDKIFHVGLTPSTIGQFSTFSLGQYYNGSVMTLTYSLLNISGGSAHNGWYTGYLLSPFQFYFDRNNGISYSTYQYDQIDLPFGNTASPMFNPVINGQPMYDTSVPADNYYINTTASLYKQRFVMKTDVVTTYSIDGMYNDGAFQFTHSFIDIPTPDPLKYVMYIQFYREFDPLTGTANPAWLGGTGSIIPPDLGFQYSGTSYSIAQDFLRHWICDENGKSNVFCDGGTKLVVPTGESRYLGKHCTTYTGGRAIEADGEDAAIFASQSHYKNSSGNCKSFYWNDGYNSTSPGLWTSGTMPFYNGCSETPWNGDWYQNLVLQTIYLDGDPLDPYYGPSGSVIPYGNTPLFYGEKVRCVAFFGGKWLGHQVSTDDYMPPSSAYLLTYTQFFEDAPFPYGTKQNPISRNEPLTQFYNDVSPDYIEGMRVDFNDVIPKNVKQKDFILDMVNRHNLYMEPLKENKNTLVVEPREDYYNIGTQSLDWTNKVDLTTPIEVQVLAETQNKTTIFTDKEDKDWWNKEYTQLTNEVYGSFRYENENDFLNGEKKIESIFSPTPMVQLYTYFGEDGGDTIIENGGFVIPVIVSGTNQKPSTNQKPNGTSQYNYRLLYKNYIENLNRDQIYLFGGFTHSYPYAGPYDNPYVPQYSINWGQTLGEFFNENTDNFYSNLVNTYWANLLTELNDTDSKILKVSMYLTPVDVHKFYFYQKVYLVIDGVGGIYKVNSIEDYIPGQNSTCKVTLLKSNVT